MTTIDRLASELKDVEASLHRNGKTHVRFHQQRKKRGNMSFTGGNGRICIQPVKAFYDVSLSGKGLAAEMTPVMRGFFKREHHGYKQSKQRQPYWRTADLEVVKCAINHYAKTRQ